MTTLKKEMKRLRRISEKENRIKAANKKRGKKKEKIWTKNDYKRVKKTANNKKRIKRCKKKETESALNKRGQKHVTNECQQNKTKNNNQ